MALEVEQKFAVADVAALQDRLTALGATPGKTLEQRDVYFAHPCRDFLTTDEALRIRQSGDHNYITYKGPKLDAATKTRREIELPLAAGAEGREQTRQLLVALGFTSVIEVHKQRRLFTIRWRQHAIEVALDQVTGLGDFVELEIVTEESGLAAARDAILALATELGLSKTERRGYADLLFAKRATP